MKCNIINKLKNIFKKSSDYDKINAQIIELGKLKDNEFLKKALKKEVLEPSLAYFAVQKNGNPSQKWYAEAILLYRENKQKAVQISWAMIAAIGSAVSSICALLSVILK